MSPAPLTGQRILLTGVTGQVAGPLSRALVAAGNTVFGTSRFTKPEDRAAVEATGVIPVAIDLETGAFDDLNADETKLVMKCLDYVERVRAEMLTDA